MQSDIKEKIEDIKSNLNIIQSDVDVLELMIGGYIAQKRYGLNTAKDDDRKLTVIAKHATQLNTVLKNIISGVFNDD